MMQPTNAGGDPPVFTGRVSSLRLVEPEDFSFLYYGLFAASENLFRSRLHGDTPDIETFAQRLGEGVSAQFVLTYVSTGQPFGHVALYALNLRDGIGHFELTTAPDLMTSGETQEGLSLFLGYIFRLWPIRKIYAHLSAFNLPLLDGETGSLFEEEGTYRDHEFYAGRYWDIHVRSLWRQTWEQSAQRPDHA